MGIFNTSDQIAVSSVTYPLNGGGPQKNYLRNLFMGRILLNPEASVASTIVQGTLQGPALRLRRFTKWAYNNPDYASLIGLSPGMLQGDIVINETTLKEQLAIIAGEPIELATASISQANIMFWADKYMLENHPDKIDGGYVVDVTEDGSQATITTPDDEVFLAPLTGFDSTKLYLYTSYRTTNLLGVYTNLHILIYQQNTGNAVFDSYFGDPQTYGAFLPSIPIRQSNRFISDSFMAGAYPLVKTAVRKAFPAGSYDKLVKDLVENNSTSIDDIDFANIVFGVPLNTSLQEGKQYIYNLMYRVITQYPANNDKVGGFEFGGRLSNTSIWWIRTWHDTISGVIAPVGDVDIRGNYPYTGETSIMKQIDSSSYFRLRISGFRHSNWVYKDRNISTDANAALADEDISSFLFPIDINSLDELGIVRANQFGDYVGHIVFNSYEVNKHKWYEEGVLSMALMVVVVAVAAVTAGTSLSGSGGLLGSPAAIGGALGFSGALAIYIGTLANAIAAYMLMKVIQRGAIALLGEEAGMIVGTIAGMVAIAYGTSYMTGQPMSEVLQQAAQPQALTRLASSVGEGYTQFLQTSLKKDQRELNALYEEARKIEKQIDKLTEQNLSSGLDLIEPLSFIDALGQAGESRESFLQRTLMTGTDIAQLSLRMLENYANISLDESLPM